MYRRRVRGWMKHADFLLFDLIAFQTAFFLSCVMRHGLINPYGSVLYRNTAIVAALIQVFVIISMDIFSDVLQRGYYREFMSTFKTVCIVMLAVVFYLFAIQMGGTFSRIIIVTNGLYYCALAYLFRCIRKYMIRRHLGKNKGNKSLVLVTARERADTQIPLVQGRNYGEFQITGIILTDADEDCKMIQGIPVVANRNNAAEYICRDWVDEVFLDLDRHDSFRQELMDILMEMGMVIHVRVGSDVDFPGKKREIQAFGNEVVVTMSSNILNMRDAVIKRVMDIAGGLVGCLLTGLLFLFLAPAICIKSPGPVFFSQMRVGRNGRMFRIYKFRSMYTDAEERKQELAAENEVEDGMMFKIENDPRIIGSEKGPGKGIGNFIRKTSLDEFPQFLNVLKGDMSLVGTRPPTVDEWEKYNFHHRGRLSTKPGLTGMWQVSGRSDVTDFEEVVALDKKYISEWSLGLDMKILFRTIVILLKQEGAR